MNEWRKNIVLAEINWILLLKEYILELLASTHMQQTLWIYQILESRCVYNSPGPLLKNWSKERQSLRLLLIVLLLCYHLTWSRLFASEAATVSLVTNWPDCSSTTCFDEKLLGELWQFLGTSHSSKKNEHFNLWVITFIFKTLCVGFLYNCSIFEILLNVCRKMYQSQ